MKIALAANDPKGFNFCEDGEPVMWGRGSLGCHCGCERAFAGMKTHTGATLAEIVGTPLSEDDLVFMMSEADRTAGHIEDYTDMHRAFLERVQEFDIGNRIRYAVIGGALLSPAYMLSRDLSGPE